MPPAPWRVFGTRSYFRLWLAQVVSRTGGWIGLIAILAIAARASNNSGAAVSLVMLARVVPGFFLNTVGGVLMDRLDRRRVMVVCDVGRASLLVLLPFVETLGGLVLISFALEILTLVWGPAKDASVPHLVRTDQLPSANTLSLVASYAAGSACSSRWSSRRCGPTSGTGSRAACSTTTPSPWVAPAATSLGCASRSGEVG